MEKNFEGSIKLINLQSGLSWERERERELITNMDREKVNTEYTHIKI